MQIFSQHEYNIKIWACSAAHTQLKIVRAFTGQGRASDCKIQLMYFLSRIPIKGLSYSTLSIHTSTSQNLILEDFLSVTVIFLFLFVAPQTLSPYSLFLLPVIHPCSQWRWRPNWPLTCYFAASFTCCFVFHLFSIAKKKKKKRKSKMRVMDGKRK